MIFADGSILDLIRPPDGYKFRHGVWITHDLNTGALVDLVLPALAGVSAKERRVRRSAPSALVGAHLAVVAAQDRVTWRAMPPQDLVTAVRVSGRRLHAKFIVLHYEREAEPLKGTPARRISRAIVTSANLTKAGLTRNREVWVHQDTPSTAGAASSLSVDLLPIAAALLALQGRSPDVTTASDTVQRLLDELPRGATHSGLIAHSLASAPRSGLLAATGLTKSPAQRVAIVTPAFAPEDSAGAVKPFGKMLRGAEVDLYIATDRTRREIESGARVAFSGSVIDEIRRQAGTLTLWAVPPDCLDDNGDVTQRKLHAKVVLVLEKENLHVLAGSANLTGSGMGGVNRELMVHQTSRGSHGDFYEILSTLDAVELPPGQVSPAGDIVIELPTVVSKGLAVTALFQPAAGVNAGMRRLHGTLTLGNFSTAITGVRVVGRQKEVTRLALEATQPVTLDADAPAIEIRVEDEWFAIPVINTAPLDSEFWEARSVDGTDSNQHRDLFKILVDIRRQPGPPRSPRASGSVVAGKFTLPFERRLAELAKAVPYLRSTGSPSRLTLDEMLDEYFNGHPDQRAVAAVLANVIHDSPYRGESPLLSALQTHMMTDDLPVGIR
jgi:phosphatidylserine/phosphatidylglycerophosphate/cardiolipin synthase-like enzyme